MGIVTGLTSQVLGAEVGVAVGSGLEVEAEVVVLVDVGEGLVGFTVGVIFPLTTVTCGEGAGEVEIIGAAACWLVLV